MADFGGEKALMKIRAFIACDVPESILEKTSKVRDGLEKIDADVSWARISGIHITLKFLGDIEEKNIDGVAAVIAEKAKGQRPFDVNVRGSGAFPNLKNMRVVWLGMEDGEKGLSHLRQALDDGLKALGFEPEEREFRPHLTLGRVKGSGNKEELAMAVSMLKDIEIGTFNIDRIMLYKSELRPTGAVYTKLREVVLGE